MHAHRVLTNLLYPPVCLLCHARLSAPSLDLACELVCDDCQGAMVHSGRPLCTRCGVGLPGAFDAMMQCASCRDTPLAFEMARAPWRYAGAARVAVQEFKYHRRWRLGRWLAQEMVVTARSSFPLEELTGVLPVPLYWLKQRLKGYNPAEQLACLVARSLETPYVPGALRRARWTGTQTRLSWHQRFRNVARAFAAHPALVQDRSFLLIDDVLTSGATANACAVALKEAGARAVFVLTAARTPSHD